MKRPRLLLILFAVIMIGLVALRSVGSKGSPADPSRRGMAFKYSTQTQKGDRTLDILLDMRGLGEKDILHLVERFALTNNLVSRGVGPSQIGGSETQFFALDKDAIDSALVKVGFRDSTNAVIEAVYKGTNEVYFDALKTNLYLNIETHFAGRIITMEAR
jgi:hypothetical protein